MLSDSDDIMTLLSGRESLLQVFFYLLWQKSRNKQCLTNVRVPDTVVLNHSRAIDWYFTSKDGTIKKKSRQKLASTTIAEHFTKSAKSRSGAVATLISRDTAREDGIRAEPIQGSKLRTLLADGIVTGTLQLFIDPKKDSGITSNHEIVCSWTPNVFYVEKRSNTSNLFSEKISLEDRTAVSETSRFVHVAPVVSSRVTAQVELLCQTIAQHIEGIHGCRVTHLGIHMKIDDSDNLWVLFCSDIRIGRQNPPGSASLSLALQAVAGAPTGAASKLPSDSGLRSTSSKLGTIVKLREKEKRGEDEVMCSLCRKTNARIASTHIAQKHVLFPLAVMAFVSSHPPGTPFVEDDPTDDAVPAHVQLLHPDITAADYRIHRADPAWDDQMVFLCSNCTTGLESITTSLEIGVDGAIRVPDRLRGPSAYVSTAAAASSRNHRHLRPMARMRQKLDDFSSPESQDFVDAEVWEDASNRSNAAPLYKYDASGAAVPAKTSLVAPRRRQAPSSAPRPVKLEPLGTQQQPIDPRSLGKALNKVSPITQPNRRARSASVLPAATPAPTPDEA